MQLANPPVVEVGIDFFFEPDPQKRKWGPDLARPFVNRFEDAFPHVEVVHAYEIRIERTSPKGVPEQISGKTTLDHIKAHDEAETRWIQVGQDQLGYRLLRCGQEYPGFEAVQTESVDKLEQYIEHFRPSAVRRATLTYLDIVEIPLGTRKGIELEEYFQIHVKLPENPFGPVGRFAFHFLLPQSSRADQLALMFASEPSTAQSKARFRMHWQVACNEINSLAGDSLRDRLAAAHQHMVECFLASFTPRGLELFSSKATE